MAAPLYDSLRSALADPPNATSANSTDAEAPYTLRRVETNQRALIDKILARYATQNAVYRELLQNSNDAGAGVAEIRFSTTAKADWKVGDAAPPPSLSKAASGVSVRPGGKSSSASKQPLVKRVVFRNDGNPFSPADWSRLSKIAEGNPDPSKIGAFGVGAYTMFSVCEEPMVISGGKVLVFVWKGDALWTRVGPVPVGLADLSPNKWTTFVLPSRDLYPLPSIMALGKFLASSLTFTKSLHTVRVYVDEVLELSMSKEIIQAPKEIKVFQKSAWRSSMSWLKNDSMAVRNSSSGVFTLGTGGSITESITRLSVTLSNQTSSVDARYVSAPVSVKASRDMAKRMERVTKKAVPEEVRVEVFMAAGATKSTGMACASDASGKGSRKGGDTRSGGKASSITASFAPTPGSGRIYIGFQTSQTTGLAVHVSAPFVPTVEREAIDLVDPTLRVFNTELLEVAGIVLRLGLERAMCVVGERFDANKERYLEEDERLQQDARANKGGDAASKQDVPDIEPEEFEDVPLDDDGDELTVSKSFVSFAKYMARGVKSTIVNVVRTVDDLVMGDEESELLRPYDPRPLAAEEHDAVMIMRSFCPHPSTPDPNVGAAIAKGFTRAMPISPPVLTRTGVVRGADARLPHGGIEAFVKRNVVRRVLLDNATEYHEVIAECRLLKVQDLVDALAEGGRVLEENEVIRLIKWWVRYSRLDHGCPMYCSVVKQNILFHSSNTSVANDSKERGINTDSVEKEKDVMSLSDVYYYVEDHKVFSHKDLPMPFSVLSRSIQDAVGDRVLSDVSLRNWFAPLPIDVWAKYACEHASMTEGLVDDAKARRLILSTLSREHDKRQGKTERSTFSALVTNLLSEKRCVPFELSREAKSKPACVTDFPSELYLASAELDAFNGLHSFRRVCPTLTEAGGVSDAFLLALGVRKSVSLDFLFSHLETLSWSKDPRPLITYLQSASLTDQDLEKLRTTQYLPAVGDRSRTYAPPELYLESSELSKLNLPFVRMLQWSSGDRVSPCSSDGKFLVKLGCQMDPPLYDVLQHLAKDVSDDGQRSKCLNFVCKRLAPGGPYENAYANSSPLMNIRFLPCVRKEPLGSNDQVRELHTPDECYLDSACQCMGFPVLDPELDRKSGRLYGSRFQCASKPPPQALVKRLLELAECAQSLKHEAGRCASICSSFEQIFSYLSTRSNEFDGRWKTAIKQKSFIPCKNKEGDAITWHRADEVYFNNPDSSDASLVASLFHVIEFSPFLAAVGVRSDISVRDIFSLLIADSTELLRKVGVTKYIGLLHRIAADPPFKSVTKEIRQAPFLMAYQQDSRDDEDAKTRPVLARAGDIYIIDNSFFGRMFPVLCAPHDSDLEELYAKIGSQYISASIEKTYKVTGAQRKNTKLTAEFSQRLRERRPLLISSKNTSRPLVKNAAQRLDDKVLDIVEVDGVKAIYTLGADSKSQRVTCCSQKSGWQKISLFISEDYDMFDVGSAIGDLILQRCQVEDAFLLSNLLEAPIETLRSRGFAVDRVVKLEKPEFPPKASTSTTDDMATSQSQSNESSRHFGSSTTDQQDVTSTSNETKSTDNNLSRQSVESTEHTSAAAALSNQSRAKRSKSKLRKKSGSSKLRGLRFLEGSRGHSQSELQPNGSDVAMHHHRPPSQAAANDGKPISPQADASSHKAANHMLMNALRSSRAVNARGIQSPDRLMLASPPKDLERGSHGCEIIPGQQLKSFGKTPNGIKVFYSLKSASSEGFLHNNYQAVIAFAAVLKNLCQVYSLRVDNIAIYHEPTGNTIAFNSSNALYFNLRLFHHLHFTPNGPLTSECYSYWFTTMAHELAHNLVSEHNKDHGYYTESYVTLFLPKFSAMLFQVGIL